jgi:Ca2+-binding RTX toxin-like protein
VTISGAGDLDLGEVYATGAGIVTIDASGLTGDLTVTATLGADTITGGDGDDIITGAGGADSITGGDGADTFVFGATAVANGADTITDFETGSDVLDLAAFGQVGGVLEVGAALTATAATVFFLGGQAATAADSAAGAAAAINAATVVADTAGTSWFVISDDDSSAVYSWTNAGTDEVVAAELTLVATITGTVDLADILVVVAPV